MLNYRVERRKSVDAGDAEGAAATESGSGEKADSHPPAAKSNSIKYSPLLENLRQLDERHELARKPRDNPDSRRNSIAVSGDARPVHNGSRRGSFPLQQPIRPDSKQSQVFQLQCLKTWEERQRLQQQKKELEVYRTSTQNQQVLQHLCQQQQQHQYLLQLQKQQQMTMQRQKVQHLFLQQQLQQQQQSTSSPQLQHKQQQPRQEHQQQKQPKGHGGSRRASAPSLQHLQLHVDHTGKLHADLGGKQLLADLAGKRGLQGSHQSHSPVQPFASLGMSAWKGGSPYGRIALGLSNSVPLGLSSRESVSPVPMITPQMTYFDARLAQTLAAAPDSPSRNRYPGPSLMTQTEKEWIQVLQSHSIPTGNTLRSFNADYYNIKLGERRARREGKLINPFTVEDESSELLDDLDLSQIDFSIEIPHNQATSSRTVTLPGVLGGCVSAGSARFPKLVVSLVTDKPAETNQALGFAEEMSHTYRPLLAIEHAFNLLLQLEEQERKTAVPRAEGLLIAQPELREETLRRLMASLGFTSPVNKDLVMEVMMTPKGISLIARILPALTTDISEQVVLAAFRHLSEVGASQDCDIEGIRNVLPLLARPLLAVLKICDFETLSTLVEYLICLPDCSDGSPGSVAVLCYGGSPTASLLSCLITEGFKRCMDLPNASVGTISRQAHTWRSLTVQLYHQLEEYGALINEFPAATQFFSQMVLVAGSSYADMPGPASSPESTHPPADASRISPKNVSAAQSSKPRSQRGRGLTQGPAGAARAGTSDRQTGGRTGRRRRSSPSSGGKRNSITVVRLDCR